MAKQNYQPEIYLIRHCETVMNVNDHLVGGRSNQTPPTPKGVEQSKRLGRILLAKQIIPTAIHSSPALRTLETAKYSLAEMGLDMKPIIHDDIQELSQGVWEGRLRSDAYGPKALIDIARQGKDFKLEGGESMNDVGIRMYKWLTETIGDMPQDEPSRHLVYTHGGAIKYLASHINGWGRLKTFRTPIDNTSVSLIAKDGDDWEVVYLNRDAEEI